MVKKQEISWLQNFDYFRFKKKETILNLVLSNFSAIFIFIRPTFFCDVYLFNITPAFIASGKSFSFGGIGQTYPVAYAQYGL